MRDFKATYVALGALTAAALVACAGGVQNATGSLPLVQRPALLPLHHHPRFLHEFKLEKGAYPSSIVAGSDGAMWFGTYPYFTNHPPRHLGIGRIKVSGEQHYFKFGQGVYDVAEGSDGNVWFTNPYATPYTVGFITSAGKVTQFPSVGGGLPESMAADTSGHLWYTDFGGNPDIIEIATDGSTVAGFKVADGSAVAVAHGATGLIWFNTVGSPISVGRITRHGRQLQGPIGGPSYIPGPMALGPDGRMWICDGDMLAAVDSALGVTLYTNPAGGGFADVTAGPDGNIWATDFVNSAIVRVTTGGKMSEYPTPTPNMIPNAIAAGPDGNIWFTEIQQQTDKSRIGVLQP
ncbi:MAG: hypothetical protein JO078_05050 [Candidatus Eremiobacteraeota bacterium]|nr:hypothetical protein [Candidatus Eremiobacteraeota bacterium]